MWRSVRSKTFQLARMSRRTATQTATSANRTVTPGGFSHMPHMPQTVGRSSGAVSRRAAVGGFVRRRPGVVLGGAATGLAGASLARNTGPGAIGNGYMPVGTSSGGMM